jgi:uncharacterized protein (DUF58 family)
LSKHSEIRKTETTTAAGNLLKAPGLVAMAAVFILAAWYSQTGILLLAGLFLSTAGLARLWSRLSLAGVHAERVLKSTRFFPGEPIECTLRLLNRKPLPLSWVQLENDLPAGFQQAEPSGRSGAEGIRRSASLLWYRSITWKLKLVGQRRGYYPIGPLKIRSGDFLGLYSRSRRAGGVTHLTVYPKIVPVDVRLIPSLHPMGEFLAAQRLFRDPTHTIGVREYLRSDSLKSIHWKATARRGDLQVKVLAATTTFKVALFLDVDSFRHDDAFAETDFELGISAAGSIAAALCERGSPVGLFVIASGAGRSRVTEILETLAKVTDRSSGPAAAFLDAQKGRLASGTTVIFLAARLADGFADLLADLKSNGFRVLVLLIGEQAAPFMPPGIPWHRVRRPDDLAGGAQP